MLWMLLAMFTAVSESAKDILSKQRLHQADEYLVAWAWRCFALPFLLPPFLLLSLPPLGPAFWQALLISGGLNVVATVLYMKAIKASDLSLTVPMVAISPLFLLLTSPLLLGETPGPSGVAGVLLIVTGAYRLKAGESKAGLLAPLRALLAERGPRLMLLVAVIWSVSANFDKIGVRNSSPLLWAAALNLFIAAALLPLVLHRRRGKKLLPDGLKGLFLIGTAGGLGSICQMNAITLTQVPYVIAVKRTSILMSGLWGHLRLGETGLRERAPAALLMAAGVALLTIG
jgi:drug/metabolite transporter (DMT)-like permease